MAEKSDAPSTAREKSGGESRIGEARALEDRIEELEQQRVVNQHMLADLKRRRELQQGGGMNWLNSFDRRLDEITHHPGLSGELHNVPGGSAYSGDAQAAQPAQVPVADTHAAVGMSSQSYMEQQPLFVPGDASAPLPYGGAPGGDVSEPGSAYWGTAQPQSSGPTSEGSSGLSDVQLSSMHQLLERNSQAQVHDPRFQQHQRRLSSSFQNVPPSISQNMANFHSQNVPQSISQSMANFQSQNMPNLQSNLQSQGMSNLQSQKMSNLQSQGMSSLQSQNMPNLQSQNMPNLQSQNMPNLQSQNMSNLQSQNMSNLQSQNMSNLQSQNMSNFPNMPSAPSMSPAPNMSPRSTSSDPSTPWLQFLGPQQRRSSGNLSMQEPAFDLLGGSSSGVAAAAAAAAAIAGRQQPSPVDTQAPASAPGFQPFAPKQSPFGVMSSPFNARASILASPPTASSPPGSSLSSTFSTKSPSIGAKSPPTTIKSPPVSNKSPAALPASPPIVPPDARVPPDAGVPPFPSSNGLSWNERLVSEMRDLYHVLAPNGSVVYCSPSVQSLTGWSPADLTGKPIADFLHRDDVDAFMRLVASSLASRVPFNTFYRFRQRSDTHKFLLMDVTGNPHVHSRPKSPTLSTPPAPDDAYKCIVLTARPYPSQQMKDVDDFLNFKLEHEQFTHNTRYIRSELDATNELLYLIADRVNSAMPSSNTSAPTPMTAPMHQASSSLPILSPAPSVAPQASIAARPSLSQGLLNTAQLLPRTFRPDLDPDRRDLAHTKRKKAPEKGIFVCRECGRMDSPEWRKGPDGPKSLCNACGLRWAKKTKEAKKEQPSGSSA